MENYTWDTKFVALFDRCVALYRTGSKDPAKWFSEADLAFLASFGYKPGEFFDFVDDHCRYPDMAAATALTVAAVRRDYFLHVQKGVASTRIVDRDELPAKSAAVQGIVWLPRLLAKAKAKLRGEMHYDTMFGCGGDRGFFQRYDIMPAEFLTAVWRAGDDDQQIIDWVKSRPVNEAYGPY